MKSLLTSILFILISTQVFGQTNYNTILNQPKDTLTKPINLNIIKAKRLNTAGHLIFASSILSTIVFYHTNPKTATLFVIPATLCVGGMSLVSLSSKYEEQID
jgi:hypothetical protein